MIELSRRRRRRKPARRTGNQRSWRGKEEKENEEEKEEMKCFHSSYYAPHIYVVLWLLVKDKEGERETTKEKAFVSFMKEGVVGFFPLSNRLSHLCILAGSNPGCSFSSSFSSSRPLSPPLCCSFFTSVVCLHLAILSVFLLSILAMYRRGSLLLSHLSLSPVFLPLSFFFLPLLLFVASILGVCLPLCQ